MRSFRLVHLGVAAALAAATATAFGVVRDVGAVGMASSFVPIVPCRLADTRLGADHVGIRATALGPSETVAFTVWGTNGNCTIPNTATGIAANVTAVNPTAASFLTMFPADAPTRPTASNLNWTPTSPPTPNQVTVALSATGVVNAFNLGGTIDVIIDIVGYYQPLGASGVGPRGFSAWDTIPSQQTVIGGGYHDSTTVTATFTDSYWVPLPGRAPVPLDDGSVNFAPGNAQVTDSDFLCNGTVAAPTAPPGRVCIYTISSAGMTTINGRVTSVADRGFFVSFRPVVNGGVDMYINFAWAYTAP